MLNTSSSNRKVSKSNLYSFTARYRRAVKQETKQRIFNLAALNCTAEDFDLFRERVSA